MIPTIDLESQKDKKVHSLKKVKKIEKLKIMWEVLHGAITLAITLNPNLKNIHQISYL